MRFGVVNLSKTLSDGEKVTSRGSEYRKEQLVHMSSRDLWSSGDSEFHEAFRTNVTFSVTLLRQRASHSNSGVAYIASLGVHT